MSVMLNRLFDHSTLSRDEAKQLLTDIANEAFTTAQTTAIMTAYNMRSVDVQELAGFRDAMLQLATPVNLGTHDVIDLCGTGGDGKNTFNISTLASFVVAACGIQVAKHGNYGVSSVSGSSNVLEALGYRFTNNEEQLKRELNDAGITILHAPLFHPAMARVAPIRKELGVKTFFNMLGPLVNPARPAYQSVGVFSMQLARSYGYLLQDDVIQGQRKSYSILHAHDGYDEVSLTGPVRVITDRGVRDLSAGSFGSKLLNQQEIYGGGTIEEAARIFRQVLAGQGTDAQNAVVCANAAVAMDTVERGGVNHAYAKGITALTSGAAQECFDRLLLVNAAG